MSQQPDGFLALPASGKGYPVLVLHAWWGLNETINEVCSQLAGAGFAAFAADLYHGKVTDQIPEAEQFAAALDGEADQARADIKAAVDFLKQYAHEPDQGAAVIGFSLGAYYALDLSANDPDNIRAVVLFYGTGPVDFSESKAEYLGHFAANDDFEPQENVEELADDMRAAGRPVTIHTYPDTGHWFFEPDRAQAYHPAAAKLAWERTIAFLKRVSGT